VYCMDGRLWNASVQTLFIVSFCQCFKKKRRRSRCLIHNAPLGTILSFFKILD
jgi:hypothetical protein